MDEHPSPTQQIMSETFLPLALLHTRILLNKINIIITYKLTKSSLLNPVIQLFHYCKYVYDISMVSIWLHFIRHKGGQSEDYRSVYMVQFHVTAEEQNFNYIYINCRERRSEIGLIYYWKNTHCIFTLCSPNCISYVHSIPYLKHN